MDLKLRDKTALVVAASKGIGKGAALALAREGCSVIITSSNKTNLDNTQAEIKAQTGGIVHTYVMDVRLMDSINTISEQIVKDQHHVDILITNGPAPISAAAATVDPTILTDALSSNFVSVIHLCRNFLPGMIQKGFGRIINLASSTGKEPEEGMVLSSVTRAGVLAYAKTLSREVARYGITVNSILTGSVMTEHAIDLMQREAQSLGLEYDDYVVEAAATIPAGYIATPEQFCHVIAFLSSPLSMYVNGVSLPVDGGFIHGM